MSGHRLEVRNPKACAITIAPTFKANADRWPKGYPAKGRLVHWSEPCDYLAT